MVLATRKDSASPLVHWQAAVDDDATPSTSPPQVDDEEVIVGEGDIDDSAG